MFDITFTHLEKAVLEFSLKEMFEHGYDSVDISKVAAHLMLKTSKIEKLFCSDDVLRMNAIRYAAYVWSNQVFQELSHITDTHTKLQRLVYCFAAGTKDYFQSLSLYIDTWKLLKDSANEYIRTSLEEIYNIYFELYISIVSEIDRRLVGNKRVEMLGWLLIVISDGFHIQSLIQSRPFDFNHVADILLDLAVSTLQINNEVK